MRERVDKFGVAEPEIQRTGTDQIDVSLPGVENADQARNQVGKTAQMYFYDWEPNVLGPGCKPRPDEPVGDGRPVGRQRHRRALAVRRRPARRDVQADEHRQGDHDRRVLPRRHEDQDGARRPAGDARRPRRRRSAQSKPTIAEGPDTEVVKIPQGTVVVAAEGTRRQAEPTASTSCKDQPALSGLDIKNPEQNFDNGTGGSGAPNVTFDFTDKGKKAWQKTTRAIAQRGQENFFGGSANNAFQHFAIVLDDEIISAPYIDFQQNPDGIDARQRLGDLRRLHDQVRAEPREPAEDRRAADQARADLVEPGLGDARQAGAPPGPDRRHRRACSSSRCSC